MNTDQRKPLVALLFTVRMTESGHLAIHPDIKIASARRRLCVLLPGKHFLIINV